jgi:tetratricopeptide (TPR) repeat protein
MSRPVIVVSMLFTLCLAFVSAPPVAAQIPDKFTNLKVLPKDIAKPELIKTMREWSGDLGVRCTYCHVGADDLKGMDFASDDKRSKRAARTMVELVRQIAPVIKTLPPGEAPLQTVGCYTCHRGMPQPAADIRSLVVQKAKTDGIAPALQAYRDLRKDHFAKGHYDFSEGSLNAVASQLLEADRIDDARAAIDLNLQYYPDAASVHAMSGRAYAAAKDKDKAKAEFQKALALDPNDRTAHFGMEQLDAKPKTP